MSAFYETLDYQTNMEFKARKRAFKKGKSCEICGQKLKPAEMMVAHKIPVRDISDYEALFDVTNWSCRCIYCERRLNQAEDRQNNLLNRQNEITITKKEKL